MMRKWIYDVQENIVNLLTVNLSVELMKSY
jgi:hypothetical protein